MNTKKIVVTVCSLVILLGLVTGCTSKKDHSTKQKKSETTESEIKVNDLNKEKETNKLSIKIDKVTYNTDKDVKNSEKLINISVDIKNNNTEDVGVGSGDFQLVSDGKTYTHIGTKEDFGDVIKPGNNLKGTGSYVIPKNEKKGKIVYNPVNPKWSDMKKLEWSFEIE